MRANVNRRTFLEGTLLGMAGLPLMPARAPQAQAARPTLPVRAKSVIQIWLWGGPAHLDTFDPKPDAGSDYCGPYSKPLATNVDGIRICEKLPLLARQADKYSIIRSMTHGLNGHEKASYCVQTGHKPGRLVYPCAGAVFSLFKGYDRGYRGPVPPYIVLTEPQGRFSEAGFLGPKHKPFPTGGDPNADPFVVEGIISGDISDERQLKRRQLLHNLDSLGRALPENEIVRLMDQGEKNAYEMMFGDARRVFDLNTEDDRLRDRYGRNTFGQSCLMARRLVEAGVPYITINDRGWDTHKLHFEAMDEKLPELDRGMAALLEDLADRGLLDSTIVWWGGEFGRTPKVNAGYPWNGGRNHFGRCFCSVVAGGGFKGGHVVGASDERGLNVAERPVSPADLVGSIYELAGINPGAALPNPRGLDVKVMSTAGWESSGGRLKEIM